MLDPNDNPQPIILLVKRVIGARMMNELAGCMVAAVEVLLLLSSG